MLYGPNNNNNIEGNERFDMFTSSFEAMIIFYISFSSHN